MPITTSDFFYHALSTSPENAIEPDARVSFVVDV